jgi:hypothetical protein
MKMVHVAWAWAAGAIMVAGAPVLAAGLVINEIMADNSAAVAYGGRYPDWIELYNNSDQAIALAGMMLSDDPAKPDKYVFPTKTFLGARERLVVWCDNERQLAGLHSGFALSAQGANVSLYSADVVPRLLDSVTYGLQATDFSIGRVPDGTGGWQLTKPTLEGLNLAQGLGSVANLKLNEWMALPSSGDDWFEVYNGDAAPVSLAGLLLSDDFTLPVSPQLPALSFIGPKGFRQFIADKDLTKGADHVNFKLSSSAESLGIFTADFRAVIDVVSFGTQTLDVSEGRLPDGGAAIVGFATTASPGDSNFLPLTGVVINEVLTHTDLPFEDAIELYNPADTPVDISGWFLSNSRTEQQKFRIPDGVVLPGKGFRVFYESQFNANPGAATSFTLNAAHGDTVYLAQATASGNLTGYRTSQKFRAAENGVSLGRYVTSVGVDFTALNRRTFGVDEPADVTQFRRGAGLPNAAPRIGAVVISEIMCQPPDIISGGVTNDNTQAEYIKLQNTTGTRVLLFDPAHRTNTWRLANGVEFGFPQNAYLDPFATLLVVGFDPVTNLTALVAFRATYNLADHVMPYGPWDGKLRNSGDTVELLKPDEPQLSPHPDAGFVPYVQVDKVKYAVLPPWPTGASGTGSSLQRRDPLAYGNDPVNWFVGPPAAGRSSGPLTIQTVLLSGASIVLAFPGEAGRSYTLQYRNSLSAGSWLKLKDVFAVGSQTQEVSDTISTGTPARFYRLVTPATVP